MDGNSSEYVFPGARGDRMSRQIKLTRMLRTALGEAGIVLGFQGKCRRKGCGHHEKVELRQPKSCPKCGFQLWLVPVVKPVRFHDLRHTAATLHREAGCDPLVIKLLLGHAASDATDDIYTHVSLEHQRRELDKLVI